MLPWLLACATGCAESAPTQPEEPARDAAVATPPLPDRYPSIDPLVKFEVDHGHGRVVEDPSDAQSWIDLGTIYQSNWYPALAEQCYAQAVALDADEPRGWFHRATVLGELSRLDEAIESMRKAIDADPEYAPAVWRLGLLQLDAGDAAAAAQSFRAATAIDPEDDSAWFGLAQALLDLGDADPARGIIEERLLETPHAAYARRLLGMAYRQLGRGDEAEIELRRSASAALPWNDPWTRQMLIHRTGLQPMRGACAILMSQRRYEEALARLETLLPHWPSDVELRNDVAVAAAHCGDVERAVATLESILAESPQHTITITNLAMVRLIDAGRDDDALEAALALADRALSIEPRAALTHFVRGRALMRLDRYDEAVAAFAASLRLDPRMTSSLVEMGRCHSEASRWAEAADCFAEAVEHDPERAEAYLGLAASRQELGDLEGATAALDAAEPLIAPQTPAARRLERERLKIRRAAARSADWSGSS